MLRRVLLPAVVALAAYLLAWPVPIHPVAWSPGPAPPLTGAFAPNDRLAGVERLGEGILHGPEATAIDAQGRVYTGTRDGKVYRIDPATGTISEAARTGGRPLGMAFDRAGTLYVCDGVKGLLSLGPSGDLKTLATGQGGLPFGFTDDVDVGPDGTVYFTDASSGFGPSGYREDILEHGGRGRLLAFHPGTGTTELLLAGLNFANGVAVGGDGSFLVVNETGSYRMLRYFISGPRRGTWEPFFENLPGFPDNVTWSAERRAFWVALFSPRVASLDALAPHPFLRKVVLRLPLWVQPQPKPVGWAVAIDANGRVVESLRDAGPRAFAPVTSVRERNGTLWLGSLERDALGRLAAGRP